MNAHHLLMPLQSKSLPCCPRAAVSFSGLFPRLWSHDCCVPMGRHITCQASCVKHQTRCFCVTFSHVTPPASPRLHLTSRFPAPELIWRALGRVPAAALSCDISPRCAFQQPAVVPTANRTQMTLRRVPLETRCSEIRKDPFHTSAVRQRDVRTKGKVG